MQLSQVLVALWHDARLQAALGVVALDFALGVTAALSTNTFALSKVAGFVRDDLLGKLVPWAVLYGAAKLTHDGWADAAQQAVYVGAVAAWAGSIVSSLNDLGIKVPLPARLAGLVLTGEHTPPPAASARPATNHPAKSRAHPRGRAAGTVALLAAAMVGTGTAGHFVDQPTTVNRAGVLDAESTHSTAAGLGCGKELWDVKTLTDSRAIQVDLAPRPTTVADLTAAPVPASNDGPRTTGLEMETFQVTAMLTGYKEEADSDYHLVLDDGNGHTMIAEIPAPGCAMDSRVLAQITKARNDFEAVHPPEKQCFKCLKERDTLTGVAFFDRLHGQTGVAPNAIELHPVLSFAPAGTTLPPAGPTGTSGPTGPSGPTGTTGSTSDNGPGCQQYPGRHYYHHTFHTECKSFYFLTP